MNLDKFSYIIVLWWILACDNPTARSNLRDFPPQADAQFSVVITSRSSAQSTPIGLSIVAVVRVDNEHHRIWID
ncbi:MAG: TrmO family methyltransferase [Candidatus Heimdallarchaeota archaeon]